MFYFSKDDIIFLYSKLIEDFGGTDEIRDQGMLESALNTPLQTFDGSDMYPSNIEKIARLSYGLATDHPFLDGNKRVAAASFDIGLSSNGIELKATDDDIINEFINWLLAKSSLPSFFIGLKHPRPQRKTRTLFKTCGSVIEND